MKILGLCGKKQVGKDSFGDFATEMLGGTDSVKKISYAGPLKHFCKDYLGVPAKNVEGNNFEKDQWVGTWGDFIDNKSILEKYEKEPSDNISGREVMQVIGTDLFRNSLKQDFWLDLMGRTVPIIKNKYKPKVLIITDIRFENEFRQIKDMGGKLIKIYRRSGAKESITHSSESALDKVSETDFDYIIDEEDNTSLKKLRKQVVKILNSEGLLDGMGMSL